MWILVRCMRRVLRVSAVFEPARCSDEQLALAYEQVVPTVRRALSRQEDRDALPTSTRSDRGTEIPRKVAR
jgi:hypothetical protein